MFAFLRRLWRRKSAAEPIVVEGVLSAVHVGSMTGPHARELQQCLEAAEVRAVYDCMAEGISLSDGPTVRARKRLAREAAWLQFHGR